ncbi:glutathione S-transferase [Geopyxis carbonaria]|nr:glutathione S-transferase [Geopyxis carbonaria]
MTDASTTTAPATSNGAFTDENPQFTLYSHEIGPNGWKVAQVLAELDLTYKTVFLEFGSGPNGMKTEAYEKLNPNGRIPAIVDHGNNDFVVWESNAIILYVLKKYDTAYKLWDASIEGQSQIEVWLLFQASGQGPYVGQAMWFTHYHHEKLESARVRYVNETRRVLGIVQNQLNREGSNGWLVLGRITAADISFLHWYRHVQRFGVFIESEYPAVWEWMQRMIARPGVERASRGAEFPEGSGEVAGAGQGWADKAADKEREGEKGVAT